MIKLGCNDSLPDGWRWVSAKEVMDVRDGTHDSPKYIDSGVPLVTSKNLKNGEIDFSSCQFISQEDHTAISRRSTVDDGDILYAMIGTIGSPVIVKKDHEFSIKNVALFKFQNGSIYNRYFYHFLNSSLVQKQFDQNKRGGTQKFVSLGNLRALQIPLPPLAEQKRIAAILDRADQLHQKRQQAIALADDFLRSVFLDMFGDPVTNPKGWEVFPLGSSIIHANNGLSRRRKTESNEGDIVLRLQDVHYEGIRFDKELNRVALDDNEKLRYQLDYGDLLFIRVNGNPEYVGRSAVFTSYDEKVYHNDHLIRLKMSQAYNPHFLSYLFNGQGGRKIISGQVKTSAGQHTISQVGIEALRIYKPDIALQDRFVKIKEKVGSLPLESQSLKVLFDAVSQKAFAGDL